MKPAQLGIGRAERSERHCRGAGSAFRKRSRGVGRYRRGSPPARRWTLAMSGHPGGSVPAISLPREGHGSAMVSWRRTRLFEGDPPSYSFLISFALKSKGELRNMFVVSSLHLQLNANLWLAILQKTMECAFLPGVRRLRVTALCCMSDLRPRSSGDPGDRRDVFPCWC